MELEMGTLWALYIERLISAKPYLLNLATKSDDGRENEGFYSSNNI